MSSSQPSLQLSLHQPSLFFPPLHHWSALPQHSQTLSYGIFVALISHSWPQYLLKVSSELSTNWCSALIDSEHSSDLTCGHHRRTLRPACRWPGLIAFSHSCLMRAGKRSFVTFDALVEILWCFKIVRHCYFIGPNTLMSKAAGCGLYWVSSRRGGSPKCVLS